MGRPSSRTSKGWKHAIVSRKSANYAFTQKK